MSYQITFNNTLAEAVQLQVRTGNGSCDMNESILDQQLAAGATREIETDQNVVCYRRTADPPNSGTMTNWGTFSPNDVNTPSTIDIGLM